MTKNFFPLLLSVCVSISLNAQSPKSSPKSKGMGEAHSKSQMSPEDRSKKEADKAEKQLALSPEQKSKWEQAAMKRITANKPLVEKLQGSTTPDERKTLRADVLRNGQAFDQEVNAMLNPEQKAKWQSWKTEKKKEMKERVEKKKEKMKEDEFEE